MPIVKGLDVKEESRSGKRLQAGDEAPDFTLVDTQGDSMRIVNLRKEGWVFLVFNRGFA